MKTLSSKQVISLAMILLLFVALVIVGSIAHAGSVPAHGALTYTFSAPEPQIIIDDAGDSFLAIEGFYPHHLPGDPQLPATLYDIALPPLAPLDSVTLEISTVQQTDLPGNFHLAPAEPYRTKREGYQIEDWGQNAATIVDGYNMAVYGRDAYFPAAPVELTAVSQMRKWRFATVRFSPVSYNPASGKLRLTTQVTVKLHYDLPTIEGGLKPEIQDTLMDDRAAEIFLNFSEAQSWYASAAFDRLQTGNGKPGYAIITTNQIATEASEQLEAFKGHKTSLGFDTFLVTESEYGMSPPEKRPEKIREWLKNNYESEKDNIKYVLLIGNPDPYNPGSKLDPETGECIVYADTVGDIPMQTTWPLGWHCSEPQDYIYPTDHYYADLTGDWDLNGNGYFGDWNKNPAESDFAAGGVDFAADVYVGRIPVYQNETDWVSDLGSILEKTIRYEKSTDRNWRRSSLLAAGFTDADTDMAYLSEGMMEYLSAADIRTHTMYMNASWCSSIFAGDEDLAEDAVLNFWNANPIGLTVWSGHGGSEVLSFGWICNFTDADFTSGDTNKLAEIPRKNPAMVMLTGCVTGKPDKKSNLAYSLLKTGAINTVAASSNSLFVSGQTYPIRSGTDEISLAFYYAKGVVTDNKPIGQALFDAKPSPSVLAMAMNYNLYGDPSIRLMPAVESVVSADRDHTCGLKASGSIKCWGNNLNGQADEQAGPFSQVSAGGAHTCGLKPDGSIACWGENNYGQTTSPQGTFVQVDAGQGHTCGLESNGDIDCWGWNDDGQAEDHTGPYVQVGAGNDTCGLKDDGSVDCWGGIANQDGPFIQLSVGLWHACGLKPNGSVVCWGSNITGQADDQDGPFIQVSAGGWHTCGLKPDGSIACWGDNDYGQASDQAGPFIQVDAGTNHTCARKPNGTIDCWGDNWLGKAADQKESFGIYDPGGNLITNYSFATGKNPWRIHHDDRSQMTYAISRVKPFAGEYSILITINARGRNVQLHQKNIELQPDTRYELSFAAYSSDGEDISVYLHKHGSPYTNYGIAGETFDLQRRQYEIFTHRFKTPDLPDMNDARLRFWFRPYAKAGTVYHIDHVVLRPLNPNE